MKELLKQKKVQLGIVGVVIVVAIGGFAIYESTKVKIDYTLINNGVEYGTDQTKINWMKQSTTNGNKITVTDFDTKKVGQTDVVFTVCLDETCKEFPQKLEIKDTKNPEIKLKKDKVEITESDKFDPIANIESVKDPVDGDIKKSDDKKLTNNGYLIDSNVDTAKVGDYKVKIIAYDVNGNKAEKEYAVTVKEKPEEPKTSQNQTTQQTTYTPPATTQNQGSAKPSTSGKPSDNQQTQTCVKNGTWKSSFDGKFASYDYSEALAWGKENCPENHQAMIYTIHDVCGNQAFGVYFFPTHE